MSPLSPRSPERGDGRPGPSRILGRRDRPEPGRLAPFSEYDAVWALNGDGWSRYYGLSASLDKSMPREGLIFASYTYSRTRDNLVGLAAGAPLASVSPGLPRTGAAEWAEGSSDLDIPHRFSAGLSVGFTGARIGRRVQPALRAALHPHGWPRARRERRRVVGQRRRLDSGERRSPERGRGRRLCRHPTRGLPGPEFLPRDRSSRDWI
jgi:hypothetical protein